MPRSPGPAKKPALAVVREGNPGKRAVPDQVAVAPAEFNAPNWSTLFPLATVGNEPNRPVRNDEESEYDFDKRLELYRHRMMRWELRKQARAASTYCKRRASQEWDRVVPSLKIAVGLGNCDYTTVVDLCISVARLEWCERQISQQGLVIMGQKGPCKNPLTTVATQYRTAFKTYIAELGLSPSARTGVPGKPSGDDDDPFD